MRARCSTASRAWGRATGCTWSSGPPPISPADSSVDLSDLARSIQSRLDAKNAAREQALPAARRSIRASANAIRAIHRLEFDAAKTLIADSRAALDEGLAAVQEHADIRHAGYLQDAQRSEERRVGKARTTRA